MFGVWRQHAGHAGSLNGSASKKERGLWEKLGPPATLQGNLCAFLMCHYSYWETLMTRIAFNRLQFWTDMLSSLPNYLEKSRFRLGTSPSLLNPQAIHIV